MKWKYPSRDLFLSVLVIFVFVIILFPDLLSTWHEELVRTRNQQISSRTALHRVRGSCMIAHVKSNVDPIPVFSLNSVYEFQVVDAQGMPSKYVNIPVCAEDGSTATIAEDEEGHTYFQDFAHASRLDMVEYRKYYNQNLRSETPEMGETLFVAPPQ